MNSNLFYLAVLGEQSTHVDPRLCIGYCIISMCCRECFASHYLVDL
jgi:hypothetical protein